MGECKGGVSKVDCNAAAGDEEGEKTAKAKDSKLRGAPGGMMQVEGEKGPKACNNENGGSDSGKENKDNVPIVVKLDDGDNKETKRTMAAMATKTKIGGRWRTMMRRPRTVAACGWQQPPMAWCAAGARQPEAAKMEIKRKWEQCGYDRQNFI